RHLDADEMSSYAQNALPPATRARYTEHLAECSSCRRLVTQLALSLGSTAAAAETVPAPGGLKAFLASLFSPMVLRYAVPALGLVIVAAIGFAVMKQQNSESLTARVNEQQSRVEPAATQPEAGIAAPIPKDNPKEEDVKADSQNPHKPATKQPLGAAAKSTTVDSIGTGSAPAKEPQAEAEAPAPAAATPKPEAKVATVEAQKREDAAGKKDEDAIPKKQPAAATQAATVPLVKDQRSNESQGAFTIAPSAQNKATPAPSAQRGFMMGRARPGTGSRSREEKDKSSERAATGETRAAGGRSFRKERGIWIDTEYDSSTQTVNMARGSEQFRALVADEPTIGTIAKQLDGEVIVVWKGRAYRIR
ncbi:MAG TPA: zf-HC2 domain-containing protein, partial [Pyrinomonadaceae bacterium]|nr:zf-HC2 domain-containing protein [Pyrinomonadaceae bacterium]